MIENILVDAEEIGCAYHQGENLVVALESATCQIKAGDRIALIGPSGSGKSTLLQLLGGLQQPTSGHITWPSLGSVQALRPTRVSFIFQMPSLLAPLNCVENVELPLLLSHIKPSEARYRAILELERIGLDHLSNKLPEELSGGQAQRIAVARAMACRPQLILADEPTGQLDHPTAQHLFDVLLAALAGTDTALVVATHDTAVAERLETLWTMKYNRLVVASAC